MQVRQIIYSSSTCALLRKKEEKRKIQVIFVLTGCLRDTNYTVFFDKFFNRPSFIIKVIGKSLQDIAIARMDRKEIPKIKPDKQVKRGDYEYQFIDKVSCCKWSDRRSMTLLFINISSMQLKWTVNWRMKRSATIFQSLVQILLKHIVKVWVTSTWLTKEHKLAILILNLQLDFICFFRIDGCCLCQRLHHLQYHASKRPYPA